jgi:hypothetical protein
MTDGTNTSILQTPVNNAPTFFDAISGAFESLGASLARQLTSGSGVSTAVLQPPVASTTVMAGGAVKATAARSWLIVGAVIGIAVALVVGLVSWLRRR